MKAIFALLLLVVVAHSIPVKRQAPEGGPPPPPPPPGGPGGPPPPPSGGPGGPPPPPTEEQVKAAFEEAGIDVAEVEAKLEEFFSKPEVQAKVKEFVAKLFPEDTDFDALQVKLKEAFESEEGKQEKVAAVLEEAGFDPEKLVAELKAAFEEVAAKIKAFLEDPETEAKIDAFVQKFLPPGAKVEELKAKLEEALGSPEGKLDKLKEVIENSGIDFEAMSQKLKAYFENPENTKKIEEAINNAIPEEVREKIKEKVEEAQAAAA